ncbi:Xaa-Pro peptidase family protein [Desulfovibrio sp. OttesenSCG-928-G11]|nr:Xaa-Pro peptidase family protein [Desulfovibrio sp. OttesenSCG-928-G11]
MSLPEDHSPLASSEDGALFADLASRRRRCLELLALLQPKAGGLLLFSRANIYYLTGVMCSGVFWLPAGGKPLLMVRKGLLRARLDSAPDEALAVYNSYSELVSLCLDHGAPLSAIVAAEQNSLPWALAESLQKRLSGIAFVPGDMILSRARAVKSPYELSLMRQGGERQARCIDLLLPQRITPGMSEREIARALYDLYFDHGNCCISRMNNFGEEMLMGEVSAGDNGNYPGFYNGPLGCKGQHRSAHFLGAPDSIWMQNSLAMVDTVFCHQGYNTDTSRCYFAGSRRDIPAQARKAHDLCLAIEEAAASRLRPGIAPSELYAMALDMADKAGFGEGFMGLGGNKVPFLGHGVGLHVDEWPVLARRFDLPLEEGMTLALEPKIGLPGIAMVGTENSWEVTGGQARCLTGGPCDIICVEE